MYQLRGDIAMKIWKYLITIAISMIMIPLTGWATDFCRQLQGTSWSSQIYTIDNQVDVTLYITGVKKKGGSKSDGFSYTLTGLLTFGKPGPSSELINSKCTSFGTNTKRPWFIKMYGYVNVNSSKFTMTPPASSDGPNGRWMAKQGSVIYIKKVSIKVGSHKVKKHTDLSFSHPPNNP